MSQRWPKYLHWWFVKPLKAEMCSFRQLQHISLIFISQRSSSGTLQKLLEWNLFWKTKSTCHIGWRGTVSLDSFCLNEQRVFLGVCQNSYLLTEWIWRIHAFMDNDVLLTCFRYGKQKTFGIFTRVYFTKCEGALHRCFTSSYERAWLNVDHLLCFRLKTYTYTYCLTAEMRKILFHSVYSYRNNSALLLVVCSNSEHS